MQSRPGRKRFLITGAAGSTGTAAIASLIQQGHAVRALVHREDERSAKLRMAGADVIVGDVLDLDDARSALGGVDGAYFVYPIAPGLILRDSHIPTLVSKPKAFDTVDEAIEASGHGLGAWWLIVAIPAAEPCSDP